LPESRAWFRRHGWVYAVFAPLAAWVWLVVVGASAFGREIRWRGYRYKLSR